MFEPGSPADLCLFLVCRLLRVSVVLYRGHSSSMHIPPSGLCLRSVRPDRRRVGLVLYYLGYGHLISLLFLSAVSERRVVGYASREAYSPGWGGGFSCTFRSNKAPGTSPREQAGISTFLLRRNESDRDVGYDQKSDGAIFVRAHLNPAF